MAANTGKRKAVASLGETNKRLRVSQPPSAGQHDSTYPQYPAISNNCVVEPSQESEDEEEDYRPENDDSSDEENHADTPITPFSPGRKKFPSELKTIKCTHTNCTKVFNRPARLTAHLRTHTNERPHACTYEGCDKAYFEAKHLQQHIKGSHTKERSFSCDWEGCNKSFLTSTRLNRHKNTHTGQNVYRCTAYPPCNEPFRKHQTLQRHIRSVHLHLSPFPCTYMDPITSEACGASFDGGTGLKQHMDRVHSRTRIQCLQCDAPGFKNDRELQAHIKKEHANCLFCDIKCSSQRELVKHIEIHHSGISLEQRKNVPCTYTGCNKRFTKQNNLNTHIRTAHMGERFICGTFDLSSYPDMSNFDLGDGCGNDFVSKVSLMDHVRTAHLGLKSLANASRKKTLSNIDDEEEFEVEEDYEVDEEAEDEDEYVPTRRKSKRNKNKKSSAMDDLVDPRRSISCLVTGCRHMFIRNYDLQVHMRASHPILRPELDPDLATFNDQFPFPDTGFEFPDYSPCIAGLAQEVDQEIGLNGAVGFDWELQEQTLEGGPFWVGADNGIEDFSIDQDEWNQDQMEMRGLID